MNKLKLTLAVSCALLSFSAFAQCLPSNVKGSGSEVKALEQDFSLDGGYAIGWTCPKSIFENYIYVMWARWDKLTPQQLQDKVAIINGDNAAAQRALNSVSVPVTALDTPEYSKIKVLADKVKAQIKEPPIAFIVASRGTATTRPAYSYDSSTNTVGKEVERTDIGSPCDCLKTGIDRTPLEPMCSVNGKANVVAICERKQ